MVRAALCRSRSLAFLALGPLAYGADGVVTVTSQSFATHLETYAQVQPIADLPLRSAAAGVVTRLAVVPGVAVHAGEQLAELSGPEVGAWLARREAAVHALQARLAAATQALAVQRAQLPAHLSTRQSVADAESAEVAARGDLKVAEAEWRAAREQVVVRAPVDGTVLTLDAAEGERIAQGQSLLTLQPADRLWLRADYYGSDITTVKVGMTGRFAAADRTATIPVRVTSVAAALTPDGGAAVGMVATGPAPDWRNGEAGTVTLDGPARSLVAVPTRALILDQGRWWVLVHTPQGNRPQAVMPGPARGWQTFLERGLAPGAEVVVDNAYLEFHRGIAARYQPPD